MVWALLRRGLLVGVLAGLAAGAFAFVFGEPLVQDAIDIEEARSAHAALTLAHVSDWTVSRAEQRGGLFLATALYGAAAGVLFALAFAMLRGRGRARDDWQLSVRIALAFFVVLVLLPFVKYPATPPGVGDPETITERTWLYLALLAGGLVSLVAASRVAALADERGAAWRRHLAGGATFAVLAAFLLLALPGVDEVPPDFPASLLWEFRLSALGTQAVLWTVLGAGFGIAAMRASAAPAVASAAR